MVVLVSISVSFFYSEKNFHAKKIRSEKFSENEKEENDVSEKFFLQRSYPDNSIDMVAYDKAIQQALKDSKGSRALTGFNLPWVLEGPNNIGGRFNCMAINAANNNIVCRMFNRWNF